MQYLTYIGIFCLQFVCINLDPKAEKNLVLLFVIFRSSQRTPLQKEHYARDPYIKENYYPHYWGELTNEGKRIAYNIGRKLNKKYGGFLGKSYHPDIIKAESSHSNRAQATLQLIFASLFSSKEQLMRSGCLQWQPFEYSFEQPQDDKLFFSQYDEEFQKAYNEYIKTRAVQDYYKEKEELIFYIEKNTGQFISNTLEVQEIYKGLAGKAAFGFALPEWTKSIYPDALAQISAMEYTIYAGNDELRKRTAGAFLTKIIDNINLFTAHQLLPLERKAFFYCGHTRHIAALLIALNLYELREPPFDAFLSFELHEIRKKFYIRIFYNENNNLQLMKLSRCVEMCPLEQFIDIVGPFLEKRKKCS